MSAEEKTPDAVEAEDVINWMATARGGYGSGVTSKQRCAALRRIAAWTPPTPDQVRLKLFFFEERLQGERIDWVKAEAARFAAANGCANRMLQKYATGPFVLTRRACLTALVTRAAGDPELRTWFWTTVQVSADNVGFDFQAATARAIGPDACEPERRAWLLERIRSGPTNVVAAAALRTATMYLRDDPEVRAVFHDVLRSGRPAGGRRLVAVALQPAPPVAEPTPPVWSPEFPPPSGVGF